MNKMFNQLILQLYKIFNLIVLWIFSENKWTNSNKLIKENLLSDRETILYLKKNPTVGIIRYGNSELGLIVGNSPKSQKYDKELKNRLVNTCQKYNLTTRKKYLLALPIESLIPGRYNSERNIPNWYPGLASRWAMRFLAKKSQIYGSAFCFRIRQVLDNDIDDYIRLIESLFIGRNVIYVGPMQGKNLEVPAFLKPLEFLKIPEKNAFEKYKEILEQVKMLCEKYENPLVVMVGGTTASALSYELNLSNITCYDFGQYERLYKKYLKINNEKNN
tara:strand:+ start:26 stop:850 length:825 start_codon:yes stop_codon:yes gene_type:complete